jgi:acyl-CoA synthetase (AMP-forming)/AMP-acid ligase II
VRPIPNLPASYLEANATSHPTAPAVLQDDLTLTFADLRDRVNAAAGALVEEGVLSGQVVAVSLPNTWEYVVLELAVPLIGAVLMPLPLNLGERERAWALERSGAVRIIELEEAKRLCASACRVPVTPGEADPDRVVEIALTSGTTGLPKLAALHAGLKQATFEGFTARLGVRGGDRVLPISPLMQGIGGMCLLCLRVGAALVMVPDTRFTPERTLAAAAAARATHLVGVPTNILRMLESPALDPSELTECRVTAVAGAPMPAAMAQAWEERTGSRVVIFYGSMDAGQLAVGSPEDPPAKRWTTVGRVHDCAEAMITPAGEICMRGPTVQRRYWGEERGPYSDDGWVHMGDLGSIDADGYLRVTGRIKDVVIRGGTNINPYEVEDLLRSHPGVRDVCVVGRPDRVLGERLTAFIVATEPVRLSDLREHLQRLGVARYKWPDLVSVVEEIPLSGPGKVDRRLLKERAAELTV